ncbi:AraC family transcriptional regulator [Pedobacter terrae]|uniref:AraC family transcriptional regulator n=1 Tax=Pedobacter terrae TaxID=405671 RepID=UPI002FFA128F
MKILPFTMVLPQDKSIISEHVHIPHFYPYLHRHDEWQITYIEQGEGTLIIDNSIRSFNTGDIFVIGAKLPHLFKSNPEYFTDQGKSVVACSIYFDFRGILAPFFALPELMLASNYLSKNKHGFKVSAGSASQISSKMFDVHNSSGLDTLFTFLNLITGLQELGGDIEQLGSDLHFSNVPKTESSRLNRISSFIKENYYKQITLEDVAKAAFITPRAFCRYFRKHTGHTFVSFLNEVRITNACKSLLSDDIDNCLSRVAYAAGFTSVANFNRVFKNIVGQSPKAYIEAYNGISSSIYTIA